MGTIDFNVEQNLNLFREMLTCGTTVYSWAYDQDGQLFWTNCDTLFLNIIFTRSGCLQYMVEYGRANGSPLILSSLLGLMWCAVFEPQPNENYRIHVIGPVVNNDVSISAINTAVKDLNVDLKWRTNFSDAIRTLPVITSSLFFQYSLMLHYCVTGEKLTRSDIQFQQSVHAHRPDKQSEPVRDRHQTYMAEQALLRMVREGSLYYQNAMERAGQMSNGVRITGCDPVLQAIISASGFAALCTRAAIEGGLSPETAYSVGDSYIQSMIGCKSITDVRAVNHEMYEDFIQRVHKCRTNPRLSKQIQSCCDYIELHLEDDLSIKLLAKRVGYSDYYLSRKFKKELKISIGDYIKFARVDHACALLTTTDLPIHDIAARLKFCSSTHFSDAFRNVIGKLPLQYRQEFQKI